MPTSRTERSQVRSSLLPGRSGISLWPPGRSTTRATRLRWWRPYEAHCLAAQTSILLCGDSATDGSVCSVAAYPNASSASTRCTMPSSISVMFTTGATGYRRHSCWSNSHTNAACSTLRCSGPDRRTCGGGCASCLIKHGHGQQPAAEGFDHSSAGVRCRVERARTQAIRRLPSMTTMPFAS